jgi:transposase
MPEIGKKYDREFREGAVRIVEDTGKLIPAVARDLGVNEGTLGNWMVRAREARDGINGLSTGDIEELKRLRAEKEPRGGLSAGPPVLLQYSARGLHGHPDVRWLAEPVAALHGPLSPNVRARTLPRVP